MSMGLERMRGVLPRHMYAGPRSAGRRGPSSGELELTCLNNRRFLFLCTTFLVSSFLQVLYLTTASIPLSFIELYHA